MNTVTPGARRPPATTPTPPVSRPVPHRWRYRAVVVLVAGCGAAFGAYVVGQVLPSHARPPTPAARSVTASVDRLVTTLASSETAVRSCPALASADGLACAEAGDQQIAVALRRFTASLRTRALPEKDAADVRQLTAIAGRLADDLQALSGAATPAQYGLITAERDVRPLGAELERATQALLHQVDD